MNITELYSLAPYVRNSFCALKFLIEDTLTLLFMVKIINIIQVKNSFIGNRKKYLCLTGNISDVEKRFDIFSVWCYDFVFSIT